MAALGSIWEALGVILGGPGGNFGVHFGAYFSNFGTCWAFGLPFGPLGFHSGAHVALLGGFWTTVGSIFDLFWESFPRFFWIIFETSFSGPFRDALGITEPAERETRRASCAETCTQMRSPLPPVPPATQLRPPRNHLWRHDGEITAKLWRN